MFLLFPPVLELFLAWGGFRGGGGVPYIYIYIYMYCMCVCEHMCYLIMA